MFGTFRVLLALMVVAAHIGIVPRIGQYAVFGFYILSGYLMTMIMHTQYGYSHAGITRYAANRFLRIYPLYWFSLVLSAVLIWYLGESFTSQYNPALYFPKNIPDLLKNVSIYFPFRDSPRLTPPAWALTVEICFYVLIGLGLSRNKYGTVAWFMVSLLYHVTVFLSQMAWEQRYVTVFAASLPFSTGALIFHYRQALIRQVNRATRNFDDYAPHALFFCILANWKLGYLTAQLEGIYFYSNYILCSLMVVVLADRKKLRYINKDLDKWLGDFSYPAYLIHYQISLIAIIVCRAIDLELRRGASLLLVSTPLILLASWAIAWFVERPIERLRTKVRG